MHAVQLASKITWKLAADKAAYPLMKKSGFTLVELVTVILLLGILSAIALPRFFDNDSFTSFFDKTEFESALSWTRNRAITSQCAHEFRITSTGWMVLRDDDRDGDVTDFDCASVSNPGNGCSPQQFFSFVYRTDADIIRDSSNELLNGGDITAAAANPVIRLIFTADGELYRLNTLPGDLTLGCTALPSNPIPNNQVIGLQQLSLTADGGTAYVAIQ
jgi:prepilin-type N-terminal cleavage/methylation domain-containing protein